MTREAATAGLVLAAAAALFFASFQGPSPIFLDFGPNDGPYVTGFRQDFEIDEPTLIHWSLRQGRVRLPFIVPQGPLSLRLRYKRHMERPAEVRLFVAGRQVDRFEATQQDFQVRSVTIAENPRPFLPLEITLLAHSTDPRPLGLALDWLDVRATEGPVLPAPVPFLYLLGTVLALYVFPRLAGLSRKAAVAVAVSGAVVLAFVVLDHKLWPLHAATRLGLRFPAAVGLVLFACWRLGRRPGSAFAHPWTRWALLAFYVGTAIRLFALFHPDFYYPDIRTHSKLVSVIWTEGLDGFFTRYIENQHRYLLGLQQLEGRWLAFPYPPLLYLSIYPLSLLRLPVDDWMKIVPTMLVGIEALMVYAIGFHLGFSGRASAIAAGLHATARLVAFRLAVASFAALFGHFWDVAIGLYLVLFFSRMRRLRYGLGLAVLVAVSLLSYAGSVLVLGLFIPAFSVAVIAWRRENASASWSTALWSLSGAVVALLAFYLQYVPELMPEGLSGTLCAGSGALVDPRITPWAAVRMALHRVVLFYGPVFGALLFLGLPWAARKVHHPAAGPLAAATVVSFLGLNFLRSGLGETHIFQFSKDALVLLPMGVLVLGNLADLAWARGRWAGWAATGLVAAWMGWGVLTLSRDVSARFIRPGYAGALSMPGEKLPASPPTRRAAQLSSRASATASR